MVFYEPASQHRINNSQSEIMQSMARGSFAYGKAGFGRLRMFKIKILGNVRWFWSVWLLVARAKPSTRMLRPRWLVSMLPKSQVTTPTALSRQPINEILIHPKHNSQWVPFAYSSTISTRSSTVINNPTQNNKAIVVDISRSLHPDCEMAVEDRFYLVRGG